MIDHRFIKDLIDRCFVESRNTPMPTSVLREQINRFCPVITTQQIWQTLNDPRFAGDYGKTSIPNRGDFYEMNALLFEDMNNLAGVNNWNNIQHCCNHCQNRE